MINSELDFISFRSSFVIFQSFFFFTFSVRTDELNYSVRRTGRDYHECCERSFIDFIRHRLPRERAQKSNLRKMQIGDSPNFPRLDKLTPAASPYPPSRPRPPNELARAVGSGWSLRDRGTEIERITAERGKRHYLSLRLADIIYQRAINILLLKYHTIINL